MSHPSHKAAHDSIKALMQEWAGWQLDRRSGWPTQVSFARERVQSSNRCVDTFSEIPRELMRLDAEIERLAPPFKRILSLEYFDRRPQKTKAEVLKISRQVFSQRLLWIHEQLAYVMFGAAE